MSKIATD